jgi:hypothetical protein
MCNQRGNHLYSTHRDAYKALPRLPFGKSDHNYILLILSYKQKLKQKVPVTRSIWKWSDDADATLQDCCASTDWNIFRDSSNGIEEYTTSVIGFINKCIDNDVPKVTLRTHPNQKPWITCSICIELKVRPTASRSGTLIRMLIRNPTMPSDEPPNKQSVNTGLRLNPTTPVRRMWQGLKTIPNYKRKLGRELISEASPPDKLLCSL